MSSFVLQLPWSSNNNNNTTTTTQQYRTQTQQQDNDLLSTLDIDTTDVELAALLAEASASGKPLTEDVVVGYQLTQFPTYGTNPVTTTTTTAAAAKMVLSHLPGGNKNNNNNNNNSSAVITTVGSMDGSELDDGGDYHKDRMTPEGGITVLEYPTLKKSRVPHVTNVPTNDNWLAWMGITTTTNSTATTTGSIAQSKLHEQKEEECLVNVGGNETTTMSTNCRNKEQDTADWDAQEQYLWKEKPNEHSKQVDKMTKLIECRMTGKVRPIIYRTPLILSSSSSSPPLSIEQNKNNSMGTVQTIHTKDSIGSMMEGGIIKVDQTNILPSTSATVLAASATASSTTNIAPSSLLLRQPIRMTSPTKSQIATTTNRTLDVEQQKQQQPFLDEDEDDKDDSTLFTDRQHWMPDQLCKQCYTCETPFTVFRRRHHCRLCGQVFCNTCSANFVTTESDSSIQQHTEWIATTSTNRQTVRVCQMCYEASQMGNGQFSFHNTINNTTTTTTTTATTTSNNKSTEVVMESDGIDKSTLSIRSPTNSMRLSTDTNHQSDIVQSKPQQQQQQQLLHQQSQTSVIGGDGSIDEQIRDGNRHMGRIAADHLEGLARELLRIRAPLLYGSVTSDDDDNNNNNMDRRIRSWIHKLLTLATKCCTTVRPNVKRGDLLDIRPYVKIKIIPGGTYKDCAYMSGIVFRKTVTHKRMARIVDNPRIMLLSGGIEFTRTENRIASLETLFEQEDKYMEILVGKILKLKPDVLLVGRSVSRKAQELLLKAGVVLVRHVKSKLLNRISRQTGATVISSTDHIMNQFGASVIGKCKRFRLVAFRDNEIWTDAIAPNKDTATTTTTTTNPDDNNVEACEKEHKQKSIKALLADPTLSNHDRQAALAANRLGEDVLDGCEAVRAGLAKRGVANTYIMLEGCPPDLGCTVVLRGADRATLKEVKFVLRFLTKVAYNLRLETSFLKERGARIRPDYHLLPEHLYSSSLCVDYGQPPDGRKIRPWNGGNSESIPLNTSTELTAIDHQSILVTSVWMTDKTQCCPAEIKGICYYSLQDVALGQFLRDSCFNLSLKCQNPNCKKSVLDHSLSFVHNDGLINIMVEEMSTPLPTSENTPGDDDVAMLEEEDEMVDRPIATWTYCQNCKKVVTPMTFTGENTWKLSFGKFLEGFFYNRDAIMNAPGYNCSCNMQSAATLYFGCGKLAARFTYENVARFGVYVRKSLPLNTAFHWKDSMQRLSVISVESSNLFVEFDKHIEKITREARSLFNSAVNRPEHLQTVFSELNRIGSEVDDASQTLQEKIASISKTYKEDDKGPMNATLFQFPLFASRYLFNLTTAWNEKLSAAGQAITAMKKIAASSAHRNDNALGSNVAPSAGDPLNEELAEGMKRLRQLMDHYARYNVTDITQVLPALPEGDNLSHDVEYDEEFDDPDASIDFPDGVDADVLASRRRLKHGSGAMGDRSRSSNNSKRPTKALGTRRSLTHESSNLNAPPKPTPGGAGAVKSALTRFFNRGGRDFDRYVVELGIFAEGRPRLPLGVDGTVIPVFDEQQSSIIAYSLASVEYAKQFKHFIKSEGLSYSNGMDPNDRRGKSGSSKPDLDGGVGEDVVDPDARENRQAHGSSQDKGIFAFGGGGNALLDIERRMLNRNKSHIKHTFRDVDEKGQVVCKFVCTTFWATQFYAVRREFLSDKSGRADGTDGHEIEQNYIQSLASAYYWAASGGKSGASFARTSDDRFVIKCISRTELQMFLDCAPAYFEYLSKAFFHGLPTVLCKIVGVYQIGVHNRETGKRSMEQVAVMQNIFYNKKITRIFDLKGSLRGRFAAHARNAKEVDGQPDTTNPERGSDVLSRRLSISGQSTDNNTLIDETVEDASKKSKVSQPGPAVLLDGDFLEFTMGRPMPLTDRAKAVFQMSILNDTLFLSIINVLDYSIVVGVDEDSMELVVGIIDFMRQYDILKQMERVGKSLPMVVGSEAPTIIQPPLYKARFTNAMERYFMTVPSKWTTI